MLCGVKYCGGCNPRYDRGGALRKIKDHFEGRQPGGQDSKGPIEFQYAEEGIDYDVLLVISGCTNNCASVKQYKTKKGIVGIWDGGQIDQAIEELEKLLQEKD